jgi:hypothetical protein
LFADYFHPEDGGDIFLRNISSYKRHMASHPRRRYSLENGDDDDDDDDDDEDNNDDDDDACFTLLG